MSKELIEQLRDLANCRHNDLSIGYEAADRIEELERQLNQPVVMSEWQTLVQERDQLREHVKMLRDALLTCSVGDFSGSSELSVFQRVNRHAVTWLHNKDFCVVLAAL